MSHYFSKVRLVAGAHQHDWLRNLAGQGEAYRDHALIWKMFPGDNLPRDFLFRSLTEPRHYYVVSARPPAPQPDLFEIQCKPYLPRLEPGEWLQFDLRANPTVSLHVEGRRSQRHDVLMHAKKRAAPGTELAKAVDEAGREWILKRAGSWGLEVDERALTQNSYRQNRLQRKGHRIEFSSLDYQGLARVTDSGRLQRALLEGVGHAKGFGCGLLLVRRPS